MWMNFPSSAIQIFSYLSQNEPLLHTLFLISFVSIAASWKFIQRWWLFFNCLSIEQRVNFHRSPSLLLFFVFSRKPNSYICCWVSILIIVSWASPSPIWWREMGDWERGLIGRICRIERKIMCPLTWGSWYHKMYRITVCNMVKSDALQQTQVQVPLVSSTWMS